MDIRIQAVVISSVVAISLFFIRDLLLPKLKATKEEKKQKIEIYKKYAEPLGKSAESMFWRLNEIFSNGTKAKFLERGKVITDFDNYKYISTLYRLGALLGWITAIKKEQSYIRASNDGDSNKIGGIDLDQELPQLQEGVQLKGKLLDKIRMASLAGIKKKKK